MTGPQTREECLAPNQLTSNQGISNRLAPSRFAPGIVDELMQDDLSQTDMHWLGGLGKAWRLQATVRSSVASPRSVGTAEQLDEAIASAMVAPEEWLAPKTWVAPEDWKPASHDEDFADNASEIDRALLQLLDDASQQWNGWAEQAADSIDGWRRSASFGWQAARYLAAPVAYQTTQALPDLTESLATSVAWLEELECAMTAELCGFESAYLLGQQLSNSALMGVNESSRFSTAVLAQFDAPPSVARPEINPEMFVIYTDSNGIDTAIPASLARAWNRPDIDESLASSDQPGDAVDSFGEVDIVGLQSELLVMLARQLDAIGIACLQTADELHNWADNQIASRNQASNR